MPDLSTTAGFFEAPARIGGSAAAGAFAALSGTGPGASPGPGGGAADISSIFANLIRANAQQLPGTPPPAALQLLANGEPAAPSAFAPGNGEGPPDTGLHPGEAGLQQAIDAALQSGSQAGEHAAAAGADATISANAGSANAGALLTTNPDQGGDNTLPDDPATSGAADDDAAAGDNKSAAPGPVGKPVASIFNGQAEAGDEAGDETGVDGESDGLAQDEPGATPGEFATSGQFPAPITGPESTPGAAAKAIAWSLASERGIHGTPGGPNDTAANKPEFNPFPPGTVNAKGPAAPGKSDPNGAGFGSNAEDASGPGKSDAASQNRSPVADARNHHQFAQLLNSEFGERPGSSSSSPLGTPDPSVFASPAGMASPVVRTAFQSSGGAPLTLPVRSLAVHIAQHFDNGQRHFKIRLDPPELGRIEVRMEISREGRVTAQLTADQPDTFDALQRDVRGLERALQTAGLDTGEDGLSFHLREQQPEQHHASSDRANTDGEDDQPVADEAPPGRIVSLTAVDIRV